MAGASMRDIKRRIKSVNSTRQITKAMELVASSKLGKARERMETYRPYFQAVSGIAGEVLGKSSAKSEYVEGAREIKNSLYIVVAGDKGLCGGFNTNTFKLQAAKEAENEGKEVVIVPVGLKSVEYYSKRNYNILKSYQGVAETITYAETKELSDEVLKLYSDGEIDEVFVVYTQFVSMISQQTKIARVLPLSKGEFEENVAKLAEDSESMIGEGAPSEMFEVTKFQPNPEEFFELFVPQYVESMIYGAMVESYVSEQGARRNAMENASDNASEMIDQLTLFYNRARQAAITQEITEIVAGADALQ